MRRAWLALLLAGSTSGCAVLAVADLAVTAVATVATTAVKATGAVINAVIPDSKPDSKTKATPDSSQKK